MLSLIVTTVLAVVCMPDDICWVTTLCFSTALAVPAATSRIASIDLLIVPSADTTSADTPCSRSISATILLVASSARVAPASLAVLACFIMVAIFLAARQRAGYKPIAR